MSPERIKKYREACGPGYKVAYVRDCLWECLDEIERLQHIVAIQEERWLAAFGESATGIPCPQGHRTTTKT